MAKIKTNAMRILDEMKIEYNTHIYSKDDDKNKRWLLTNRYEGKL